MRSILALGLLIAVCAAANAATVHHFKGLHHSEPRRGIGPRYFFVHPGQGAEPRFPHPDTLYPPVIEDQTPSYDDPSKFSSG